MRLAILLALFSVPVFCAETLSAQIPNAAAASMLPSNLKGQASTSPPVKPEDAIPLTGVSNVSSSISVDAVLLPPSISNRIFGKEVSDHYAVVEMIVSNRNPDAALIIHSAMLDYSDWLFSGAFAQNNPSNSPNDPNHRANQSSQVASAESRLVRGELQDAQLWTKRNAFIRAASLIATVASGYQFLASSQNYLSGIDAFGNQVVPALSTFWPDRTQLQINRISDFGFQTNHVIAKSSSDVVVAFFPIDRFLTPFLHKQFAKAPAAFFVPGQMLIDPTLRPTVLKMLVAAGIGLDPPAKPGEGNTVTAPAAEQEKKVSAAEQEKKAMDAAGRKAAFAVGNHEREMAGGAKVVAGSDDALILHLLDSMSLNHIRVVVSGVMTVDTNSVPAVLDTVTFTGTPTWKKAEVVDGVITGSFLSDGTLSVLDSTGASVGTVTVDTTNSTDKKLTFTLTLANDLTSDTKLEFAVTKTAQDKSQTVSKKLEHSLADQKPSLSGPPTFTEDVTAAATWKKGTVLHGSLKGLLLTGATASGTTSGGASIGTFAKLPASTDAELDFTLTLNADIPTATKLNFLALKKAADGSAINSGSVEFNVSFTAAK